MNKTLRAKQNPLGIMQGRLSPKKTENLQSFPHKYWKEEFYRAAELGFDQIEWLVDSDDLNLNPLGQPDGPKRINALAAAAGVKIKSLCAHFLIHGTFTLPLNRKETKATVAALSRLLVLAPAIGIEVIVVPLMGKASLGMAEGNWRQLKDNLIQAGFPSAICTLALETDLPAPAVLTLLDQLDCDRIRICYDIGNATALNFDVSNDFSSLASQVVEIHIKDRFSNGGGNCCLGFGNTPVREIVLQAKAGGYSGAFILETPVEDDWQRCAYGNMNVMRSLSNELL